RQRQVVGDVAGVLGHVEPCVVLVGRAGILFRAMAEGIVVVRITVIAVLGDVGDARQFQDVVVGDVPVDLCRPAGIVVTVVLEAAGSTRGAGGRGGNAFAFAAGE